MKTFKILLVLAVVSRAHTAFAQDEYSLFGVGFQYAKLLDRLNNNKSGSRGIFQVPLTFNFNRDNRVFHVFDISAVTAIPQILKKNYVGDAFVTGLSWKILKNDKMTHYLGGCMGLNGMDPTPKTSTHAFFEFGLMAASRWESDGLVVQGWLLAGSSWLRQADKYGLAFRLEPEVRYFLTRRFGLCAKGSIALNRVESTMTRTALHIGFCLREKE